MTFEHAFVIENSVRKKENSSIAKTLRFVVMSEENVHRNIHPIVLLITHVIVFIVGLYVSQGVPYIYLAQYRYENLKTNSVNASNATSFFSIGTKYQTDKVTFHHYETMYEKYLPKYIGTNVSILEIGLGCKMTYGPGASAYLWRHYLGPRANIHFVEYDRNCSQEWYKEHGEKLNVTIHYGNQEDIAFLKSINNTNGDFFDVIIDDGGHTMKQQITSLTYLFEKVRSGGLYVIEDLQTSYFSGSDSGYLVNTTTMEFIKRLVDDVQNDSPKKITNFGNSIFSLDISSRICFFKKK